MADPAREYLAAQGVQETLTAAVKVVVQEKPANAKAKIIELLMIPEETATEPVLSYFGFAGRGELAKLCAAGGGVKIKFNPIEFGKHGEFGPNLTPPMPASLPILQHDGFTMYQSLPVETYICNLSPKYAALTPKQKALDDLFAATKEDVMQALPKFIFGPDDVKATVKEAVPPLLAKAYSTLESLIPASGFVHGLDFPTKADLTCLNLMRAVMPYAGVMKLAGVDFATTQPKMARVALAASEYPPVKAYLADNPTIDGDPFGLMK